MTDKDPPSESNPPTAESLFRSFQEQREVGDAGRFDELCEQNSNLEEELRQLYRGWQGVTVESSADGAVIQEGKVLGDYRLLRRIGRGGMGEVWECEQVSLRRNVALKFLHPTFTLSERELARFQREAEACGRLSHSAIVSIYGKEEAQGVHFIVQELVPEGRNLHDFLSDYRERADLPSNYYGWVASFFLQVAEALRLAHEEGVTHRDIKPANILIDRDDRPKVTDFGLAKFTDADSISVTGEMSGTYLYMSPEQAMAKRIGIDHRTDIFSLCATLYEALTMNRAFEGDTAHQVIEKILMVDPPAPRLVRSRVPRDLSLICMKGLEKQRVHRYQSMAELAEDLRRFSKNQPIAAKPPGALRRLGKWSRRHPAACVGLCVGALALLAVTTSLAITWKTKQDLQQSNIELAQANQSTDTARRALLRLADLKTVRDMTASVNKLWPGYPHQAVAIQAWLRSANDLAVHLPEHVEFLNELSQTTTRDATLSVEQHDWWLETLTTLVAELRQFSDPNGGTVGEVQQLLEKSKTIAKSSIDDYEEDWDEATFQIFDSELYDTLDMLPQVGFVPIGPDPETRLWEFWHTESGERPERDPDTGKLQLTNDFGMVFVLLPRGAFLMGSQNLDPNAANYDQHAEMQEQPLQERSVEPFFLSKFEMTQGQWTQIVGDNPSDYGKDHDDWGRHPVENMTWYECNDVLRRIGLQLPSEIQWEYAARAGTTTSWWTGANKETLKGAVNLADLSFNRDFDGVVRFEDWLDDGAATHERVAHRRQNPFGLSEIHGNVREWTADLLRPYVEGLGYEDRNPFLYGMNANPPHRVIRGGDFYGPASDARSASRYGRTPGNSGNNVGLRPARQIDVE